MEEYKYMLKVFFRDGTEETLFADEYDLKDGCLYTNARFEFDERTRYIPLDMIKECFVKQI